jgi:predicted GNAT family acetyltransferase
VPFSPPRLVAAAAALLLASLTGCLGLGNYQFGARTLFPDKIETVYVPVFDSSSYRRGLGEELTEAVIKEIERRGVYKVVPSPSADTVLTGKITGEAKHLLFENLTGDPREMEVSLVVKVSWVDRRGSPVQEIPLVPVPAAAVDFNAASGVVAEVGQSIATSHQQAIRRLAEQIVSLMEKPW